MLDNNSSLYTIAENLKSEVFKEMIKAREQNNIGREKLLNSIYQEIDTSEKVNNYQFYFPIIIIDSWDYADELGNKLLEYVELYHKSNKQ